MKCPNCNIELERNICIKCGYMENGNYIEKFKKEDKYTDIRIYNEAFDEMNLNLKKWKNFILGPFYFSYRNHIITGTIIGIIAFLIFLFEIYLTNSLNFIGNIYSLIAFFNVVFYITINRILYMGFSNVICLAIDKKKINKIKEKNKNYIEKLVNHKSTGIAYILIQILIYAIIIGIIYIIKGAII